MSKLLPYEEQWLLMQPDIQLPDEDMAWADMKARLEKKKKRRFFWWYWGCLGWGLFFAVVALLGFSVHFIVKSKTNKTVKAIETSNINIEKTDSLILLNAHIKISTNKDSIVIINNNTIDTIANSKNIPSNTYNVEYVTASNKNSKVKKQKVLSIAKNVAFDKEWKSNHETNTSPVDNSSLNKSNPSRPLTAYDTTTTSKILEEDRVQVLAIDSTKTETVKSDSSTDDEKNKQQSKQSKKVYFTAGAGLQQLIPIQGQGLIPYSASGRKSAIGDYIPSLFFKVHKGPNWFLQTEFRYGAPQTTKSFVYKETNVPDTGINPAFNMITSTQLRKTFYHQLPVTINYRFNNKLSVGLGVQVNKFQAAIGEQSIVKHDNITLGDTLVSKTILTEKNATDAGFSKTYLLGVAELQYQWHRFSVGAKYTYGLQPYIRFSINGQPEQKESSRSLQIMLRYQLWKSK